MFKYKVYFEELITLTPSESPKRIGLHLSTDGWDKLSKQGYEKDNTINTKSKDRENETD